MSRLPHATSAHPDPAAAQRLLRIVRRTVAELRPDALQDSPVSLHSRLDSDLGLDSLGRVELWSRVEREFAVRLPQDISYLTLQQGARAVACGLQQHGLRVGQRVALMLPAGCDFLFAFFGILLAGAVPVPIYPPVRLAQIEEHLRRQAGILANAEATMLITVSEAKLLARLLKSQVPSLREIASVAELSAVPGTFLAVTRQAGDLAFLQYTSGSTGQPKGVMISHANLLANLRAMGAALHVSADDVFVSWLPMYHDMGLIGAWLGSLYYGFVLVLMSPLAFLSRPVRWLEAIHRYRATLSAAPNFAYELCLGKLTDSEIQGIRCGSSMITISSCPSVPRVTCNSRAIDQQRLFPQPAGEPAGAPGEWLDSLDLAYMAASEVYLSGRAKDLIIRGGRNIYPYDLEAAVGNVPGLRKGCVAVFGCADLAGASERLVVLAETNEKDARVRQRLQQQIRRVATDLTGVPPDDIVLAARAAVPLVPVAIGGSRRVLRGDQWFPRRGAIHLHICAQLLAQGPGRLDAITLRDDARAELLQHLDEPDPLLLTG